jgi:hypothetical protein
MEKIIFLLTFVFQITWTFLSLGTGFSLGTHIAKPFQMTISNALPVQFWDEAEETFNEKQVCGIDQICWCMPWHCANPIPFQFTDTEQVDYVLRITNSQGVETDIPFDYDVPEILNPISTWVEIVSVNDSWDDTGTDHPSITLDAGFQSDPLSGTPLITPIPQGSTVVIECRFIVTADPMDAVVKFYKAGVQITPLFVSIPCGVGVTEVSFDYTGDDDWDELTIEVSNLAGSTGNFYIDYIRGFNISLEPIIYSLSVTPQDIEICDDQVSFQIVDPSTSPATVVKKSDCLQIKESIECTLAIDYSNNKNFNGLVFEDISPSTTFRIRIPARFFSEDNPSEQEDTELSNGEFVRLYNKLEERRQLEVGFVPHYMHRKIQLALMCDNVTIDGKQWIRKETYEKVEGRKTYPLKRANVWLHDKEFIKENQL